MGACFYKMLVLYIYYLCSCPVVSVDKDQTLRRSTNTYIFIDAKTQKCVSLLTQNHQRNELMTPLKLKCMAGSQPLAVFLLGPSEGDNTKPANRMGPLRVCVLQEEGRRSPGPTWRVPITSDAYSRCQRDIVASDSCPVVIKVTMTGEVSVAGTSSGVKFWS